MQCHLNAGGVIIFHLAASITLCACPSLANAQSDSPSDSAVQKIRWAQIIDAVDRHPLLTRQRLQQDLNRANREDVRAIPNPSVAVSLARAKSSETDSTALEWGAELSIPLDWMATRSASTRVADAEAAISDSERTLLRQDVVAELRQLFWRTAYQQEKSQTLAELQAQTARLTRLIAKRVASGDARPTELTRMQIEEEKVSLALEESRMRMTALQSALGLWVGVNTRVGCEAALAFSETEAPQVGRNRIDAHPEMEKVRLEMKAQDTRIQLEKRRRFPEMAVSVFTENELDKRAFGGGVALVVPLWNHNDGPIHRAMAKRAMDEAELDVQRLRLEQQRLLVNASCKTRFHVARSFAVRVLPRVTDVSDKVERAYVLGEATLLDVLDARRAVLDARTQLMDARLEARLDCGDVQNLAGEEKP
ncbi:MAG: TolC family protein [Deltaproteobacteria bacterium]|nr:TolC family protein [Deltaproteobacteria bacterium]